MELIEKTVYLEFAEAIEAGISENTLKKASSRNSPSWVMVDHPADKRKKLINYDKLKPEYKQLINSKYGNPYDYVAKEPIRKMVTTDLKAQEFYLQYRYDADKCLPVETIKKYVTAASWLNMLSKAEEDKKAIKQTLKLSLSEFWMSVCDIISTDDIDLPKTYQRLRQRIADYKDGGYGSLIHKHYGNSHAKKVDSDQAESVLLELIAHPNQYDDVFITLRYNTWASKNGLATITPGTVGVWRRKRGPEITISRYGSAAFNEKYIRQVKGFNPSRVGLLWESDDYNLNYYFRDDSNPTNKDMQRYVSYIVADSKTGLVLGKSYRHGRSPLVDMAKLAYIDAMYYVRSLTGGWHIPHEIKTDRWQQESLVPYFESIAKYVPAAHGNKHRGYIEQLFGSAHAKRCEKLAAHNDLNYNGNNLTAVNRGVNIEALATNKSLRPYVGEQADSQVERFFWLMRNLPAITRENMEGISKEQQWLQDWKELTDEQKRPITDEQFLLLFGFRHRPQGRTITITNRGVEPQINNVKYSYDLPDYVNHLQLIGQEVTVIYDPYDMSRVLVTDEKQIRFIARSATLHPRALNDHFTNSRTALNMVLTEKKDTVKKVTAKAAARLLAIENNSFDDEAAILGHYMPKAVKNKIEEQAERMMIVNKTNDEAWETKREQYLNDTYDLKDFYDNQ